MFAVGLFDEPPPEFEWAGTVEEDEEREGGGPPILHQVHYRYVLQGVTSCQVVK